MSELKQLFLNDLPLIDVRAPIEFEAGHFPGSINLPLMNNFERQAVGTEYKASGQAAALKLGHELVQGPLKQERVDAWAQFIQKHPQAKLYCFRGGLRSQISQAWIEERGLSIEIVPGGYKAIRSYLLETLESESLSRSFTLLAGRTGSGKTRILRSLRASTLDLERYACHRGSSFGGQGQQPAQISFENKISIELLKLPHGRPVVVEDEAIMIGSLIIPKILFEKMKVSPLVAVEQAIDQRIATIAQEYVVENTNLFNQDCSQTEIFMIQALGRIRTKLGGMEHDRILKLIRAAFASAEALHANTHALWIEALLSHYYDPLYDRSMKRCLDRIKFRGNETECREFLEKENFR